MKCVILISCSFSHSFPRFENVRWLNLSKLKRPIMVQQIVDFFPNVETLFLEGARNRFGKDGKAFEELDKLTGLFLKDTIVEPGAMDFVVSNDLRELSLTLSMNKPIG